MATEKKRPLTSEIMSERSFPVIKVTVIKVIKDFGTYCKILHTRVQNLT